MDKEVGGLGIRRIREFNLALLGKWCWRLLKDTEVLWYRLLAARYGLVRGRLDVGGRDSSVWCRTIVGIRDGDALVSGSWFLDNLRLDIGNDVNSLFWLDRWVGEVSLSVRFHRLFELSENKMATVAQMFAWGWYEGGDAWRWRKRLWAWEEVLVEECRNILSNVVLQVDIADSWRWFSDPATGYTVSGAYGVLRSGTPTNHLVPASSLWRKDVPLKVSVFAWHLFRNRLSTKTNLFQRGVAVCFWMWST